MKTRSIWFTLIVLFLVLVILTACSGSAITETAISATTSNNSVVKTTGAVTTQPSTDKTAVSTSAAINSADTPQYGGTLTWSYEFVGLATDPGADPRPSMFGGYMEWLYGPNMTTDRNEFAFQGQWAPLTYLEPRIAESWEQTDPTTITLKIRESVKWQNKAPTYGRDFTASDVVFSFDRALGTGNGFTTPNPIFGPGLSLIKEVVAIDEHTVQFTLNSANPLGIYSILEPSLQFGWTAPEWYALSDEEKQKADNVVGTGAFILSDYVDNTSMTFDRNSEYWGYDTRYPENQLPYLDHWKVIAIQNMETQLSALRTAKIDLIVDSRSHISLQQAEALAKTNPEINLLYWPNKIGGVIFKYGTEPFTDVRIRKAMQMSVDTESIIENYYNGLGDATPPTLAASTLGKGWSDSYADWPESLQNEYKYNLAAAKELMTEAGYPDGFTTSVLFSSQDDVYLIQILKDQFSQIGITMDIDAQDAQAANNMLKQNTYTQMVFSGGGVPGQAPQDAIVLYYSENIQRDGAVTDSTYDTIVKKFMAATTEAECQQYLKEASRYAAEQHWAVVLGTAWTPQVYQPWIKGWEGELLGNTISYYPWMWVDQDLKEQSE